MSETPLSERQAGLLALVAEGGGDWDARRIDLTGVRHSNGPREDETAIVSPGSMASASYDIAAIYWDLRTARAEAERAFPA